MNINDFLKIHESYVTNFSLINVFVFTINAFIAYYSFEFLKSLLRWIFESLNFDTFTSHQILFRKLLDAMTEFLNLVFELLTLTTFVFQCNISFYETIKSFRFHQQRVRDFVKEFNVLKTILNSLIEIVNAFFDIDFFAFKISLFKYDNVCQDFEKEIITCSSRFNDNRTNFRDWIKLKYMKKDIDEFKRSLIEYKLIVNIAFTNAHLWMTFLSYV